MDIDLLMESDGLFQTVFPEGHTFLWRLLTLKEYRRFTALRDGGGLHPFVIYSMVFDRCFVGNAGLLHKDLPAGIPIALGQCIMWLSGDCELTTLASDIEMARTYYPKDSVKEFMARTIFTAFPSLVEEDVHEWTYPQLIRKFVIAEHLLLTRIPEYQPLDLRKIHGPEGAKRTPGVVDARELQKENRELEQAMGQRHHPLDMNPVDFVNMQRRGKGKLSPSMARKLDRRKQ